MTYESMIAANDPTALYEVYGEDGTHLGRFAQSEIEFAVAMGLASPDITVEPV